MQAGSSSVLAVLMAASSLSCSGMMTQAAEPIFNGCKACHEIGLNARHNVGPHLDGLFGRVAGSLEDFDYSKAMREAGDKGLVWSEETLDAYLAKPRDFIPGNRMSFRGMDDPEKRTKLIAYIRRESQADPGIAVTQSERESVRGFADKVLTIKGDPVYGEYLAGECTTCHQPSGHADGIPSIVGLPRDYFIKSLFEYKINIRTNEVMKLRVSNLSNEEIAALAAYFSALRPQ